MKLTTDFTVRLLCWDSRSKHRTAAAAAVGVRGVSGWGASRRSFDLETI